MKLTKLPFRALRAVHDPLMARLRSSPVVTRALFGVSIPPGPRTPVWDYTTLVMRKAIRRHVSDGMRVWDIGCGPAAIVSLFVARVVPGAEVVASDREPSCIPLAQQAARHAGAAITVIQSDLAANVPGLFDVIMFNPPYLPLGDAQLMPDYRLKSDPLVGVFEKRFGGGDDGHQVITRFLDEIPAKLTDRGRVLLGFNTVYVSTDRVQQDAARGGLELVQTFSSGWNPSRVLVFRRTAAA